MAIRPYLPALFVLVLALGAVSHAIQAGRLMAYLPEILIHASLAAFLGWRAWKIANAGGSAEYQAKIDLRRWEEASSTALMFFCSCLVLFVPLMAIASLHPQTFRHLDMETMLFAAPLAAAAVGLCRFFWWR